ncbi:MAG: glycosyl hydrolase family 8 [Clostridiaceae bacterium]
MKKKIIIFIIIIMVFLTGGYFSVPYIKPVKLDITWKDKTISEELKDNLEFIDNKLSSKEDGIFTNYLESESIGEETKGHEVLSESEGLVMLYAVEANDKARFDDAFNIVIKKMKLKNNLISWRHNPSSGEVNKASALLDDLRIAKALMLANDRWKEFKYRKEAVGIIKGILKYSTEGDTLVDFNDSTNKSDTITMCYLDIYTLDLLSKIDKKFIGIKNKSNELLKQAYLGEQLPLYRKSYNLTSKSFSNEEESETLLSMLIALYKSEAGENVYDLTSWLNKKLDKDQAIYAKYNIATGEPTSDVESTAIYAVGAQIARNINNEQLYNRMIGMMNKFKIKDKNSELYGAFGFEPTKSVLSFDNLQGILALIDEKDS